MLYQLSVESRSTSSYINRVSHGVVDTCGAFGPLVDAFSGHRVSHAVPARWLILAAPPVRLLTPLVPDAPHRV